jgi:hypothetical protein
MHSNAHARQAIVVQDVEITARASRLQQLAFRNRFSEETTQQQQGQQQSGQQQGQVQAEELMGRKARCRTSCSA